MPGITDAAFNSFDNLIDLETLRVGEAKLTGSGLDHLAGLPKLERLELDRVPLNRAGLARLGRLARLKHLTLTGDYADADFAALTKLTDLRSLTLGASRCTVAVLGHLAALPHLEILDLDLSGIDDGWVDRLAAMNANLRSLRRLNLHFAHVSPGAVGRLRAAYPGAVISIYGQDQ